MKQIRKIFDVPALLGLSRRLLSLVSFVSHFHRAVYAVIFVAALLAVNASSAAQEDPFSRPEIRAIARIPSYSQQPISFDEGRSIKRASVMHDFLNVAFSDVRWLEDMEDPSTSVSVVLNALNAPPPEENQPSRDELAVWLKPFADSAALPRHNAINKWRKSPSVGFDWPQFGESRLSEISAKRLLERAAEYEKIGRVVGAQLDELNAATNLAVTLTPPSSPRESTSDFAEIRIVIASTGAIQNNIKFARKPSELDERRFELAIKKGVRFTPKSRSQVEGFVLLNNSNEIELAVCYISPEVLDTRLLKPLVSECLIRALGLPSLSLSTVPSLLGSWNAALDSISKTDTLDGSDATEAVGKKDWNAVFREYAVQSEAPDPHPRRYDVVMLRLLYCPSIKPGFDKNMTLLTLGKTKECKIN